MFGIPKVAAINVGINGALYANASLGPAVLDNVAVTFTYDPESESSWSAEGTARFYVPGFVGIDSSLRVTVSAQVLVADLGGYLGLQLGAGLAGEVAVPVNVQWNPSKGLDIDAKARIVAKPALYAIVSGGVYVELDLLLGSVRVWEREFGSKRYELGSNLEFGLEIPCGYSELGGFRYDPDKAKAFYPTIDEIKAEGKRLLDQVF